MQIKSVVIVSCALVACPVAAFAQAPVSPSTPPAQTAPPNPDRTTQNCAPTQTVPQDGGIAPSGSTSGKANEPLGDKLAKSDGVLCPPAGIDPEMHAPTPQGGTMPVIPPPGSPGGDQTIRPK